MDRVRGLAVDRSDCLCANKLCPVSETTLRARLCLMVRAIILAACRVVTQSKGVRDALATLVLRGELVARCLGVTTVAVCRAEDEEADAVCALEAELWVRDRFGAGSVVAVCCAEEEDGFCVQSIALRARDRLVAGSRGASAWARLTPEDCERNVSGARAMDCDAVSKSRVLVAKGCRMEDSGVARLRGLPRGAPDGRAGGRLACEEDKVLLREIPGAVRATSA